MKAAGLYLLTAIAELLGCYLPLLWMTGRAGVWILVPAACALACFVWLLSLHPHAAGRVYAAYGGVYVAAAVVWLWLVDRVVPDRWDLLGAGLMLAGAGLIYFGPRDT